MRSTPTKSQDSDKQVIVVDTNNISTPPPTMRRFPSHLPKLLAVLPNNGAASIIRPAQWPKNSFYKVTKADLKFRQAEIGAKVTVGAKAWGQVFWKGESRAGHAAGVRGVRG